MRKKNLQTLEHLLVSDYAAEGKALARLDGKVIFIEGAVPGDVVDVTLTKSKKDWAEGRVQTFRVLSPKEPSPFARTSGFAGVVNGRCFPMTGSCSIKNGRSGRP